MEVETLSLSTRQRVGKSNPRREKGNRGGQRVTGGFQLTWGRVSAGQFPDEVPKKR